MLMVHLFEVFGSLIVELICTLQKEYNLAKPVRDAAAKAKAEVAPATECPVHADNEWNIR